MENVSKALVMVGGVLIGILLISFMIVMLRRGGKLSAAYDMQQSDNQLVAFNSQFEAFDKDDNSFYEIITVVNLAYDVNYKNEYDDKNCVQIYIRDSQTGATKYSLLNSPNARRDSLFNGEDATHEPIYIYNVNSGTSIMTQYKALTFSCLETKYSNVTGKVTAMTFYNTGVKKYENF